MLTGPLPGACGLPPGQTFASSAADELCVVTDRPAPGFREEYDGVLVERWLEPRYAQELDAVPALRTENQL